MVSFKKLRQMIEIQGNGNIVSREVSVSTFIRLHIACKGIIELHQGDEEKVVFETDENLQDFFTVANAGRTLYVSTEGTLRQPAPTKAVTKIFLRQMDKLYVRNDQGHVVCPQQLILTQPLKITVQSVGNTDLNLAVPSIKMLCQTHGDITLKGSCEKLEIKNQSQGNFDSTQLNAGELAIRNMADGNVRLRAEKSIQLTHFGHGYLHYYGNAVVKDVKQFGDGEIKHKKDEAAS